MNRFFARLFVVGISVGFLCLLAGEALAKNPERPYRARAEQTLVSVGECDPGVAGLSPSQLFEGSIIATHTGLGETSTCAVVTGVVSPVVFTVAGQGLATAANGDQTFFTFSGTNDVSSDPCVGQYTIVVDGGTGRFEGATGTIEAVVLAPWSAPFTCGDKQTSTLNGTLAY